MFLNNCVTWGKILSKPQFLCLQNGERSNADLIGLCGKVPVHNRLFVNVKDKGEGYPGAQCRGGVSRPDRW